MWANRPLTRFERTGFSLVELMIAAALMAMITALVAVIVQATMYRSRVLEDKQTALQQFVLLKEKFNVNVRNARVILADSTESELHFVKASQEPTRFGNLDRVSFAETTSWDESRTYIVKLHRRNGQDLVLQYQKDEPEDGPTGLVYGRLGQTGTCTFNYDELPLLRVDIGGESQRRGGTQSWSRSFKLLLESYS